MSYKDGSEKPEHLPHIDPTRLTIRQPLNVITKDLFHVAFDLHTIRVLLQARYRKQNEFFKFTEFRFLHIPGIIRNCSKYSFIILLAIEENIIFVHFGPKKAFFLNMKKKCATTLNQCVYSL